MILWPTAPQYEFLSSFLLKVLTAPSLSVPLRPVCASEQPARGVWTWTAEPASVHKRPLPKPLGPLTGGALGSPLIGVGLMGGKGI